jgi:hypothetical protein
VQLASYCAAHLARKPIAIQHVSPSLLRDLARESGFLLRGFEHVLPWPEITAVVMSKDLKTLFIAQLAHSASPFRRAIGHGLKIVRCEDLAEVGQEMGSE